MNLNDPFSSGAVTAFREATSGPNFNTNVLSAGDQVVSVGSLGALNATASTTSKRNSTFAGLDTPLPIIYGEPMMGPLLANILEVSGTWVIWLVWGVGPIHSVEEITLDDAAFYPGSLPVGCYVTNYTGTNPQSSDGTLGYSFGAVGGYPGFVEQLVGVAHSVIVIPTGLAPNGLPKFVGKIKGRMVYDPRDGAQTFGTPSTYTWSRNPALILADFLANQYGYSDYEYGAGFTVDWTTVADVADANDATVAAETSRLADVVIDKEASVSDWVETLRTAASCFVVPQGSTVKLIADATGSPLATYAHSSGNIISVHDDELKDSKDLPTVIEVWYTDTTAYPWKDAYAQVQRTGVSTGDVPWRKSTVRMPWITRYSQASREATERMSKLWLRSLQFTLETLDAGFEHEPGDLISVDWPANGYSSLTCRVLKSSESKDGYTLRVEKDDPACYVT